MREFGELNNPEKVKAILATVFEPVSRNLALDLSGVRFPELKRDEQLGVEAVFAETIVNSDDSKGRQRFWYPMDRREAIVTELDVDQISVNGYIADVLISYLPEMGLGKDLFK